MNIYELEKQIVEIKILANQVKVMLEDLNHGYFTEGEITNQNIWKVTGNYYLNAGIKMDITDKIAYDLFQKVHQLQNAVNEDINKKQNRFV